MELLKGNFFGFWYLSNKAQKLVAKLRRIRKRESIQLNRAPSNASSRISNLRLGYRPPGAASPPTGDNVSIGSPSVSTSSRISTQGIDLQEDINDSLNRLRNVKCNDSLIDFLSDEKPHESSADLHKLSTEAWVQRSYPIEYAISSSPTSLGKTDNICDNFRDALLQNLSLSYDEIERHLEVEKDMRLFCNAFLGAHEFYKETLIQLWLARGFIKGDHKHDIGNLFFQILISNEYIMRTGTCYASKRDMYKANVERLKNNHSSIKRDKFQGNVHCCNEDVLVSLIGDDVNETSLKAALKGYKNIKALLLLSKNASNIEEIPQEVFLKLDHLEVLHLSGAHITELPSSIGNLTELRYLDLSHTLIEVLPGSMRCLSKLQTLKLNNCERLIRLPEATRKLISLEHLELDVLGQLDMMPRGMGDLTKLETLSAFLVHKDDGRNIKELMNINNLRGRFCISNLENVSSPSEAKEANLSEKKFLDGLELRWNVDSHESFMDKCGQDDGNDILEQLQPNSNLKHLKISCYGGKKFPKWMSDPSYEILSTIILFKCDHAEVLPSLGQLPYLKSLSLMEMDKVKEIGPEFRGFNGTSIAFPMLERLEIIGFPQLVSWTEGNDRDYPCLSKLIIERCPKLTNVPSLLVQQCNLKHLEILQCSALASLLELNLSTSLGTLIIDGCPLITKEFQNNKTKGLYSIKHVQTIWIDQDVSDYDSINNRGNDLE